MLKAFGFASSSPPKARRVRSRNHFDPPEKLSDPRKPGAIGFEQFGQFVTGDSDAVVEWRPQID